ncbi:sigma-54 dependent transcriptional regulator [bacterium]|nr:sigma-54 dependent transcriptional regulator [bacterium]
MNNAPTTYQPDNSCPAAWPANYSTRAPWVHENSMKTDEYSNIELLIVDDENDFRNQAVSYFKRIGFKVDQAEDGEEALNVSTNRMFDVVVLDIHMPGVSGIAVLEQLMKREPAPKVIMLTGGGTIAHAVESMKKGAYDFVTKPVKLEELQRLVVRASKAYVLEKENRQLKAMIRRSEADHQMIGQSEQMQEVVRLIERTASSDKPVLIQGESGTGKELVARAIHRSSPLADKPLVVVNCAALAEQLLESELFGHEKGAFTGAIAMKQGLFELADGGTLFIDEFGEMSGGLQVKLLRILQDGTMRRVGSVTEQRVNVRVIAATNRDLEKDVADKNFREDLFYRINVLGIHVPPLRNRRGDIPLLAKFFAGPDWKISDEVMSRLESYSWPGNIRQLQNAIERAKVLAEEDKIELQNLPNAILQTSQVAAAPLSNDSLTSASKLDLETLNRMHVEETYSRCNQNKTKTARALGINRRSLYRLLEKFEIG